MSTSNRGGKRKGAGRPIAGTSRVEVRLTPDEREHLKRLGGTAWVRAQIQKAIKEPAPAQDSVK